MNLHTSAWHFADAAVAQRPPAATNFRNDIRTLLQRSRRDLRDEENDMRLMTGLLLTIALLFPLNARCQSADRTPVDRAVVQVRVTRDANETRGSAVVVHREDNTDAVVLYFLTSSRLFRNPDGEPVSPVSSVRLLDGERSFNVSPDDVWIPGGNIAGVAILRVATERSNLVARPIVYNAPSPTDVFLVSGFDQAGANTSVAEHLRFESTLFAVGDRDVSGLLGCVGAPAMSQEGVFGIVSECQTNRSPVISLLSMSRSFIDKHIPRRTTTTASLPQFDLVDRQLTGPLVLVPCDTIKTGELDMPLELGPREWVVDAQAAFLNPHEVRLAEVTVLKLEDRSVRLRFTVGGGLVPAAPPASCPQGQALVSVHVNVAISHPPE